jgi:hypothetical protein
MRQLGVADCGQVLDPGHVAAGVGQCSRIAPAHQPLPLAGGQFGALIASCRRSVGNSAAAFFNAHEVQSVPPSSLAARMLISTTSRDICARATSATIRAGADYDIARHHLNRACSFLVASLRNFRHRGLAKIKAHGASRPPFRSCLRAYLVCELGVPA